MRIFRPDRTVRYLTDLTPALVRELGCKVVLIDADNTSSYDLTTDPLPGTEDWILGMQEAKIPVLLLSNAKADRARKLADHYGIPVVGMAMKPLRQGYLRAALKLRTPPRRLLMAGDQLFTDILGAHRCGCRTVWVLPYEKDKRDGAFLLKRRLEQKLSARWNIRKED